MANDPYFINPLTPVAHDGIDPLHERLIMQVYSGDYFATLATTLDELAQGLPKNDPRREQLQRLVGDLLYLQDHYEII